MNIKEIAPKSQNPTAAEKAVVFLAFLNEQGADDPVLLELGENAFADILIVAGATSRRNAQGLADGINRICHENGYEFFGMEGYDAAEWILIDCNDVVINIFQKDARNMYKLEDLWAKNSVMLKKEITK